MQNFNSKFKIDIKKRSYLFISKAKEKHDLEF